MAMPSALIAWNSIVAPALYVTSSRESDSQCRVTAVTPDGYADSFVKLRTRTGRATFVCSTYTEVPTQLLPGPATWVVLAVAASCPSGDTALADQMIASAPSHPAKMAQTKTTAGSESRIPPPTT